MAESQQQKTTKSSLQRTERSLWLKQRHEERESWIANHRRIGKLTLLSQGVTASGKSIVHWQCQCGSVGTSKLQDLKRDVQTNNDARACRSCASKVKMQRIAATAEGRSRLQRMSIRAAEIKTDSCKKEILDLTGCTWDNYTVAYNIMNGAANRCNNTHQAQYTNYGGRGITFCFPNVKAAAIWVLQNLGPKPDGDYSIDRIDNDGNYEPGNLRWATRAEQNQNKRAYKRTSIGERIRRLQTEGVEYHYETLRGFIRQGLTDDQIKTRIKWEGCGKYERD